MLLPRSTIDAARSLALHAAAPTHAINGTPTCARRAGTLLWNDRDFGGNFATEFLCGRLLSFEAAYAFLRAPAESAPSESTTATESHGPNDDTAAGATPGRAGDTADAPVGAAGDDGAVVEGASGGDLPAARASVHAAGDAEAPCGLAVLTASPDRSAAVVAAMVDTFLVGRDHRDLNAVPVRVAPLVDLAGTGVLARLQLSGAPAGRARAEAALLAACGGVPLRHV